MKDKVTQCLLTFRKLCHAVLLHSASFVAFVDTSPTSASVSWWCLLCTRLGMLQEAQLSLRDRAMRRVS